MYENLVMKLSVSLHAVFSILILSSITVLGNSAFAAENELVNVKVTPLSSVVISAKHSNPANIISLNHSTISAEITGRALKSYVETGDIVEKGQKLLSLDCRNYTLSKKQAIAALNVAKTQLSLAKKELVRNRRLIKQGTIPRELFDKTEAAELTALADIDLKNIAIKTTQLAINRCQIIAPFSGQITSRLVQIGQLVVATTPLFELMQNDKMEIKTHLSPSDINRLKPSTELEFVANGRHIKTEIRSIIQEIDEITRTQEVRLTIPEGSKLAAGLSGRIEWKSGQLMLPPDYILRRNGQLGVMIAKDIVEGVGHTSFFVLNGAKEGQSSEVNLPASTLIINENQYRLKDGQKIRIK